MEITEIRLLGTLSINQLLDERFPQLEKDSHESDLYIQYTPEVWEYLKSNYEYFCNCSTFYSAIDKTRWIEIPFAYDHFWNKKLKTQQQTKKGS